METMTYQDQRIWGTSLGMAKDDEIEECYKYVKQFINRRKDLYYKCEMSLTTKNFIGNHWQCGESTRSSDLCDKELSIKREDLILAIEKMVLADDIQVSGENILSSFKKRKYIEVYKCGRVFFLK